MAKVRTQHSSERRGNARQMLKEKEEGREGWRERQRRGGKRKPNYIPVSYPANTYEVFTVYHASIKCLLCTVHLLSVYCVPCTQAKHLV